MMLRSGPETLARQLRALGLNPVEEYRFAAEEVGKGKGLRDRLEAQGLKDWRFDFAFPEAKLAIEYEGLVSSGRGGHQTRIGFNGDLDKYHAAAELGWTVYRCGWSLVMNGKAAKLISVLYHVCSRNKEMNERFSDMLNVEGFDDE